VDTMSTGSGAGGGDGAKVWSFSTIMEVTLWIVVGEEWESQGDALSTAVCGSGMRAGRGTTSWMQGICVCWDCTGGCGLLVILLSGCRQGAFSSWSSSWENCELAFLSSLMTQRNSGPPAVAAWLSSPSTLQVQTVLALLAGMSVEGPYLLQNLANPMRKLSNPALKSFHSCKVAGSGVVLMGCRCQMSLSTGRLMMAALERGGEVLVGLPQRNF